MKKPVEIGGLGNQYTISVAIKAKSRRGQKAWIQGRRGRSPRDHFAANQPPMIWKGKSMRTTRAKSSRLKPFSTSFSPVAASLAANPTFASKCTTIRSWTSVKKISNYPSVQIKGITLQLANGPDSFIYGFDAHIYFTGGFFILEICIQYWLALKVMAFKPLS